LPPPPCPPLFCSLLVQCHGQVDSVQYLVLSKTFSPGSCRPWSPCRAGVWSWWASPSCAPSCGTIATGLRSSEGCCVSCQRLADGCRLSVLRRVILLSSFRSLLGSPFLLSIADLCSSHWLT
ncbi:hypothetical protein B0H14DRAFT_3879202, partial [Mycena olivaceomarginata]